MMCKVPTIESMTSLRKKHTTKSHAGKGFAAMDPEKRRAIAKKGGQASHKNDESNVKETSSASTMQRGFAAMDTEKRKQIASKGGRTSRRNRIDWKEQAVIL